MMNKRFLLIIIGIFLISIVSAVPVPSPHAFYGTVDYSNGKPVEGTIITQIDNLIVGSCEIVNGAYDLVVESEYGGVIYFYLEGKSEVLETFVFKAFKITELNLIVEIPEETSQKESKSKTSHTSRFIGTCEPNWRCTGWSECSNGFMSRNCQDTNNCLYSYGKPIERTGCETTSTLEGISLGEPSEEVFFSRITGVAIVFIILIVAILFILIISRDRRR